MKVFFIVLGILIGLVLLFYVGPTKLKLSLVWLIFNTWREKKGGRR